MAFYYAQSSKLDSCGLLEVQDGRGGEET